MTFRWWLIAGLALLTGCTQERAGCPAAQQQGLRGAEWRLCPISALENQRGRPKLAGLGLKRTLTTTELRSALKTSPVRVRVAYFAAGNVRGTWAKPSALSAELALNDLASLHTVAAKDAMTWTRKNALQVIQWKSLESVLSPSKANALAQLEHSVSLRYGVLNVVREHQSWLDARDVRNEKRGFICGLQVQGTPAQLLAFAQQVGATGFTFDQRELFNSMQAADPPDLKERLQRWPGTLATSELLKLGQRAFADFQRN